MARVSRVNRLFQERVSECLLQKRSAKELRRRKSYAADLLPSKPEEAQQYGLLRPILQEQIRSREELF